MVYSEFEQIISADRMRKYLTACGGDTRRAMTLYRRNLKLSQEIFTMISCFEVTLRNKIDGGDVRGQVTDISYKDVRGAFEAEHPQNMVDACDAYALSVFPFGWEDGWLRVKGSRFRVLCIAKRAELERRVRHSRG